MELYFSPEKKHDKGITKRGAKEEEALYKLTDLVKKIKEDLEETGLPEWEVSIKGYIEASSGDLLPGGKAGFEATITISSPNARE